MADGSASKPSGEPGWKWRRAIIFPVIAFSLWRLAMLESAQSSELNETIAWGHLLIVICLVLFYSGFATFQDIAAIWVTKSGRPYQQGMQPAEPERVGSSIPDPAKE